MFALQIRLVFQDYMSIWMLKVGSIVIRFADGIFDLEIEYLISTDQVFVLEIRI